MSTRFFCATICPTTITESICLQFLGPATTQNLVVKFDGEICGGVLVENASANFPSKRSSKISFQTSPEVRHQFRRKLRQLHSGNRWCLSFGDVTIASRLQKLILPEALCDVSFTLQRPELIVQKKRCCNVVISFGPDGRVLCGRPQKSRTSH